MEENNSDDTNTSKYYYYPKEWRDGGSYYYNPLIFAMNAILLPTSGSGSKSESGQGSQELFDRFLQAIVNSSSSSSSNAAGAKEGTSNNRRTSRTGGALSLFRDDNNNDNEYDVEADNSSDDEEDLILLQEVTAADRRHNGGRGGNKSGGGGSGVGPNTTTATGTGTAGSTSSTTYANAASDSGRQGFFQRARIVSVSSRYGFPPSKDPEGTQNLAFELQLAVQLLNTNNNNRRSTSSSIPSADDDTTTLLLERIFRQFPLASGILPYDWLEKHVHALPSVILVICSVSASQKAQSAQDRYLLETMEHLQYSLIPKRQVNIQIIGLMDNEVTDDQGNEWSRSITQDIMDNGESGGNTPVMDVSLLRVSTDLKKIGVEEKKGDNDKNTTTSGTRISRTTPMALQKLHCTIRNSSLQYYLRQARRIKEKLLKLVTLDHHQQNTRSTTTSRYHRRGLQSSQITSSSLLQLPPVPQLCPLVIRYCMKIALFYEFQCKHAKSNRFLDQAYRHVARYYQWLLLFSSSSATRSSSIVSSSGGGAINQDHHHPTVSSEQQQQSLQQQGDVAAAATSPPHATTTTSSMPGEMGDDDTGVEVELTTNISTTTVQDNNKDTTTSSSLFLLLSKMVPAPPADILYQCAAVADWLNYKMLTSGFTSHTEGGLLAASNQWRMHSQIFLTKSRQRRLHWIHAPSTTSSQEDDSWFQWSYIVRQRVVMSQLVEKHPPTALGNLGNDFDEVVLRCSPWRNYVAATEASLVLAREVDKARTNGKYDIIDPAAAQKLDHHHATSDSSSSTTTTRARYLGGQTKDGLAAEFHRECSVNHRGMALEYILRAISVFEQELIKERRGFYAEDEFSERSSSRTGARLYYLAGGILLGMNRHEEAVRHLMKASHYSKGWQELELAVRRMLIECYEKHIPSHQSYEKYIPPSLSHDDNQQVPLLRSESSNESSQALASMILDSYFNAEMSSQDLRRALDHFAAMSGGGGNTPLKWYKETHEEEDPSLPFSFAVTFPGKTHATSGDSIQASVVVKSNLDYAIHVNSVALGTLAGKLPIGTNDLLSAVNASEGTGGGIIIQAKTSIVISAKLQIPTDLMAIASDESGNGGELQGVAGKGSFAKNAKPRSAGLTAAAGARLVSEDKLQPGNSNSQGWNVRFLGGKPLLCDGIHLVIYPVQAERVSGGSETVTLIELFIKKKKRRTAANIKRTPFEEENYVASAWSRPQHVPFSRGPRSLRILGPQPELVVTNVTDPLTDGRVLEGTVNRILLKLQAGPMERCSDMKLNVSCFSVLITPSGLTKRLVSNEELTNESENSLDMRNSACRTPVLVTADSAGKSLAPTGYGYDLPIGWKLSGTGQEGNETDLPMLKGGESCFVHLNFFRPSAQVQKELFDTDKTIEGDDLADVSICKTDFYVTLTYQQERPATPKRNIRRRPARQRPVMSNTPKDPSTNSPGTLDSPVDQKEKTEAPHKVSLEYSGSVVWTQPISTKFRQGAMKGSPLGNRHPSNRSDQENVDSMGDELVLVDGETISTRCSIQLHSSVQGIRAEIVSVRFERDKAIDCPLDVSLLPAVDTDKCGSVYNACPEDPHRILSAGSQLAVSYAVRAKLKDEYKRGGISSFLGGLLVDWRPSALDLPDDAYNLVGEFGGIGAHGPLALDIPSTTRFVGPKCYVEHAPFEATCLDIPTSLSVATPFEVTYAIKNTTGSHQKASVGLFKESASGIGKEALFVSGSNYGEVSLGPSEVRYISFTMVASRPGKLALPALQVSSGRFKSWIINETEKPRQLFVFP